MTRSHILCEASHPLPFLPLGYILTRKPYVNRLSSFEDPSNYFPLLSNNSFNFRSPFCDAHTFPGQKRQLEYFQKQNWFVEISSLTLVYDWKLRSSSSKVKYSVVPLQPVEGMLWGPRTHLMTKRARKQPHAQSDYFWFYLLITSQPSSQLLSFIICTTWGFGVLGFWGFGV